jgi:selenide,water dikinase
VIPEALDWVKQGVATGASDRNWKGYAHEVALPAGYPDWKRKLLCDPQTSGGLLVSCAADSVQDVLKAFGQQGFDEARVIGKIRAGASRLTVT